MDLNEAKTKKLAETITSDTSRRILNHLTEREATESVLAKELNLPLPTVHYHLQKLQEAGLVNVEEFHYSEKGREVNHYKLANKYIIIAPKKVTGLKQKLRGILPVTLIILGISALWSFFSVNKTSTVAAKSMAAQQLAMPMLEQNIVMVQPPVYADQYSVLWFLAGGLFTLLIYVLIIVMQEKIRR